MTDNPAIILVLEDDPALLGGIRDILEIQGYKVLTAGNGNDGLSPLRTCDPAPDLIVSDIMMPGMDGYKFLETVRLAKAGVVVDATSEELAAVGLGGEGV